MPPSSLLTQLEKDARNLANSQKALILQRFFKTGPGEYGAGDKFLGLVVPQTRALAKKYANLSEGDLDLLIKSPYHELRLVALVILIARYQKSQNYKEQKHWVEFYLQHTKYINNWDLVDLSVYKLLGDYLLKYPREKKILDQLAVSRSLWERRMAIISTFAFIRAGFYRDTLSLAKKLLGDQHDLIHKAVGWMLREVGKRINPKILLDFLDKHHQKMPRVALRYALEHLPEAYRQHYLKSGK